MKLIEWQDTDAYYNLAAEEYVFDSLDKGDEYFLLWQNKNAIVVGKHQNTIEEINSDYVHENAIQVVRRLSGGGAVYHDLGNLNYTFIGDAQGKAFNFKALSEPIVQTLQKLGLPVEFSGRNDLIVEGRKISGSAQMIRNGRMLHHGTLLFHSNMDVLTRALAVKADKIASKGVKSVRSRVVNIHEYLPDLTIPHFRSLLQATLLDNWNLTPSTFSERDVQAITTLREEKYATWEWNYGRSPEYDVKKERRFAEGGLCIYILVNQGMIQSIKIYGDYFGNGDISDIEQRLQAVALREDAVLSALQTIDIRDYIHGLDARELTRMIVE